jgi:hypothetical protein
MGGGGAKVEVDDNACSIRQGLVQLDAKVTDYWPEFGTAGKGDTTVRHLLCHQVTPTFVVLPRSRVRSTVHSFIHLFNHYIVCWFFDCQCFHVNSLVMYLFVLPSPLIYFHSYIHSLTHS